MPLAYPIHEATLPNGLKVVVSEDHSAPVVAVNLWVGVGSRHEQPGRTGFAHLFEHLMFQGSRNVASGEHFSALMAVGARCNATTWFDRTNYFQTLPSSALDLALWMEADRHGYLLDAVTQENLDNQRDVVKEEKRQRYDNVPYGDALRRLYATTFPDGHPYQHPTIGSMDDLDAATLEDVHAFFRQHYHPGNTVLTLAGDVSAQEGVEKAARYFGGIPAHPHPVEAAAAPALPPAEQPRRWDAMQDVPADRLYLGFRLPVDHTREHDASGMALDALAGLASSRLERRLVRVEDRCTSVSAAAFGLVDGVSIGFLSAQAADGAELSTIEDIICDELRLLGESGPTEAEMEATLAQAERGWLSALASVEERADLIGQLACLHDDAASLNTMLDRLHTITGEDITEAAARWLTPQARSAVTFRSGEPEDKDLQ